MENRIDQLVTLANGKKYVIINQAIYQNNTYFYASEVTEETLQEYLLYLNK